MNIPALVRRAVKTAERIAGSVRTEVVHFPQTGRDEYGPTYPDVGTPMKAFMEFIAEGVTLADGTETVSKAKLTFFEPVSIGDRDQFVVPDSHGGTQRVNVQAVKSPIDPATKALYFAEVWLGDIGARR
ncbi:MAG TPA: hypothetical protein VF135_11290 [Terriglobales bacterium]